MTGHRGSRIAHQIGTPEYFPGAARRLIDQHDIGYAHAKRAAGWGWQAIANCLKVNVLDLRAACGDLKPEAATLAVEPETAARPVALMSEVMVKDQVLAAINRGFTKTTEIAEIIRRPVGYTAAVLSQLKAAGCVEGNSRTGRGLTKRGHERLRKSAARG